MPIASGNAPAGVVVLRPEGEVERERAEVQPRRAQGADVERVRGRRRRDGNVGQREGVPRDERQVAADAGVDLELVHREGVRRRDGDDSRLRDLEREPHVDRPEGAGDEEDARFEPLVRSGARARRGHRGDAVERRERGRVRAVVVHGRRRRRDHDAEGAGRGRGTPRADADVVGLAEERVERHRRQVAAALIVAGERGAAAGAGGRFIDREQRVVARRFGEPRRRAGGDRRRAAGAGRVREEDVAREVAGAAGARRFVGPAGGVRRADVRVRRSRAEGRRRIDPGVDREGSRALVVRRDLRGGDRGATGESDAEVGLHGRDSALTGKAMRRERPSGVPSRLRSRDRPKIHRAAGRPSGRAVRPAPAATYAVRA